MTCDHCVAAVREEIGRLDAVQEVDIDLVPGGTSRVTVTSTAAVPDEQRAGGRRRGRIRAGGGLTVSELANESSAQRAAPAPSTVDLQVGGMTCASCAARIEKKLNRIPGVSASVNYATGNAHVELPAGTDVDDAIATVEATGYRAWLPQPTATPTDASAVSLDGRAPIPRTSRRGRCGSGWRSAPRSRRRCWPWPWSRPCSSPTGSGCR